MDYPEMTATEKKPSRGLWLGCGLVALVLVCIGLVVGTAVAIIAFTFNSIKSSDVYQQALTEVTTNPEVLNALGEPVEPGWFISGSISVSGSSGDATLSVPISGPKGKGTLYAEAAKSAGVWEFDVLQVEVEGQPGRIDLLSGTGR